MRNKATVWTDYHFFKPKNLQGKKIKKKPSSLQNKTVNMKDEWHFSKEILLFSSAICPFNIVHWSSLKINGVPITCHCCFTYHNLYMALRALVVMTFPVYPEGISLELPTSNNQAALSAMIQAGHVKVSCDKKLAVTTEGSPGALTLRYGKLKTVISNRTFQLLLCITPGLHCDCNSDRELTHK